MFRIVAPLAVAALVVGCAARPYVKPPSAEDPANPHSPESPMTSLAPPPAFEPPPTSASDTGSNPPSHDQGMPGMDMKGMPGMSHGQTPPTTQSGQAAPDMARMHHQSHPASTTQPAATQALYTCTMHPRVVSDHPGNCPICGMKLVKKTAQSREEMNK